MEVNKHLGEMVIINNGRTGASIRYDTKCPNLVVAGDNNKKNLMLAMLNPTKTPGEQ